jgi:hypothetical protein
MKRLDSIVVERPEDIVVVNIMYDKSTNKYAFVNLTKKHICECRFDTYDNAIEDLEKHKQEGKVLDWYYVCD